MKKILIILIICTIISVNSFAEVEYLYKELNLVGGYSDKDGWVANKTMSQYTSAGFEYYRKFSNDYGDYLTMDIQARLAYEPNQEFDEAWQVELHNAWGEYKLGLGKSIRLGHFDTAFGLEPDLDTHGTLFQTLSRRNIGFKKDWGAEYRAIAGEYDIELAGTLGSGMGIERKDGSYLLAGRLAANNDPIIQYGLSVLYGEVLTAKSAGTFPRPEYRQGTVNKKRVGFDTEYSYGFYTFRGELAFGQNDKKEVIGGMAELEYIVPFIQPLVFKLQWQLWDNDLDNIKNIDSTLGFGASYKVSKDITLRVAYFHDLDAPGAEEDSSVYMQFYYYGL